MSEIVPPIYPAGVNLTTMEAVEIRGLIAKCPPGRIRDMAVQAVEHGLVPTAADAMVLLPRLGEDNVNLWAERSLAGWLLGLPSYSDSDRDTVSEWLASAVRDQVKFDGDGRFKLSGKRAMIAAVAITALEVALSSRISVAGISSLLWKTLLLYVPSAIFTNAKCDKQMNITRAQCLRSIRRLASMRGALASLEAMYDNTRLRGRGEQAQVAIQAAFAAEVTLPVLASVRVGSLSPHHCQLLSKVVRTGNDRLAVGAIQVMGEMGDASCLKPLQWAASKRKEPEVVQAANSAIAQLSERLERERQSKTLLRAVSAPVETASLLRPVSATHTDESVLVRPVMGDGTEQA